MSNSYKEAGVDIAAGDKLVQWLESSSSQGDSNVLSGIGGFAALFKADFSHMEMPHLVACTDGVGTKVKLASRFNKYHGVAQDLVAMCVNDLICTGGKPLFFLDYYATSKLNTKAAQEFLVGLREACVQAQCVLIGGETAEMPGVYKENEFDVAGFCVGVVDKKNILSPSRLSGGEAIVAIESNGFHSNGYSLLRQVFADDLEQWQDYLLRPTHIYVDLMSKINQLSVEINAVSHITGGGIDNLKRGLSEGLSLRLYPWALPEPFLTVKERTNMSWDELLRVLNCGVGLAVFTPQQNAKRVVEISKELGFNSWVWGEVLQDNQPSEILFDKQEMDKLNGKKHPK